MIEMIWKETLGRILIFLVLLICALWALVMPRSATRALDQAGKWDLG